MEKKIAYKVCRMRNSRLFTSVSVSGVCELRYKLNEVTFPRKELSNLGLGIFVFDTLRNAKRFTNFYARSELSKMKILECEVTNPRPMNFGNYYMELDEISSEEEFINTWLPNITKKIQIETRKVQIKNRKFIGPIYEGTLIVDSCKPLEISEVL